MMVKVADSVIEKVENDHRGGITSAHLLAFFKDNGIRFGEATLRKWVQLGLLPRSVRVGTKGKHKGSKGLYPIRVVRQILRIKGWMAQDLTIEDIQGRYLFVRGDVEELEQTLGKVFAALDRVCEERGGLVMGVRPVATDIEEARTMATHLVDQIVGIEKRLIIEPETVGSDMVAS